MSYLIRIGLLTTKHRELNKIEKYKRKYRLTCTIVSKNLHHILNHLIAVYFFFELYFSSYCYLGKPQKKFFLVARPIRGRGKLGH